MRASKHPSLLKNRPHHTISERRSLAFTNAGHGITNNEGRAHIQQLRPPLTPIPAQEPMRPTFLLVEGKAALTLAWMACTLPAAPIPAQELTQATLFPPKRRPRSHFALSPTCSDRTRTAPLKNLDSSRGVGNYRTASAGVFTLNTHSRSRIWTVLDGGSYAAALRRRH